MHATFELLDDRIVATLFGATEFETIRFMDMVRLFERKAQNQTGINPAEIFKFTIDYFEIAPEKINRDTDNDIGILAKRIMCYLYMKYKNKHTTIRHLAIEAAKYGMIKGWHHANILHHSRTANHYRLIYSDFNLILENAENLLIETFNLKKNDETKQG